MEQAEDFRQETRALQETRRGLKECNLNGKVRLHLNGTYPLCPTSKCPTSIHLLMHPRRLPLQPLDDGRTRSWEEGSGRPARRAGCPLQARKI